MLMHAPSIPGPLALIDTNESSTFHIYHAAIDDARSSSIIHLIRQNPGRGQLPAGSYSQTSAGSTYFKIWGMFGNAQGETFYIFSFYFYIFQ
jgi:hypothetical protein